MSLCREYISTRVHEEEAVSQKCQLGARAIRRTGRCGRFLTSSTDFQVIRGKWNDKSFDCRTSFGDAHRRKHERERRSLSDSTGYHAHVIATWWRRRSDWFPPQIAKIALSLNAARSRLRCNSSRDLRRETVLDRWSAAALSAFVDSSKLAHYRSNHLSALVAAECRAKPSSVSFQEVGSRLVRFGKLCP